MPKIETFLPCGQEVRFNSASTIEHSMGEPPALKDRIRDKTPPAVRKLCPVDNYTLIALTPPDEYPTLKELFVHNNTLDKEALRKYLAACQWSCNMFQTPNCPLYQTE